MAAWGQHPPSPPCFGRQTAKVADSSGKRCDPSGDWSSSDLPSATESLGIWQAHPVRSGTYRKVLGVRLACSRPVWRGSACGKPTRFENGHTERCCAFDSRPLLQLWVAWSGGRPADCKSAALRAHRVRASGNPPDCQQPKAVLDSWLGWRVERTHRPSESHKLWIPGSTPVASPQIVRW